eukprot:Amastigsp_a512697_38.p3 type:complete len:107 gc:universal Amastigsp_a512697_38:568-888(+)
MNFAPGCMVMAGIDCMCGSRMALICTGTPQSQMRRALSSPVEMNRRPLSTTAIELTGPRCSLYSWMRASSRVEWCTMRESARPTTNSSRFSDEVPNRAHSGTAPRS